MFGYRVENIILNFDVIQIVLIIGYRLESIMFEPWCVSDWCNDWLQAREYKI